MMSRPHTSQWKETIFQLMKYARAIFATMSLLLIIAFVCETFFDYQIYTASGNALFSAASTSTFLRNPLASAPRLETAKPWTKNQTEFLKLKNVLRSSMGKMMTVVKVNSDVNLIRRCLMTRECRGVSPELRHLGTCALVGSSGILLNSSCGDEIDASDFVIRFNLSPQDGYTKDVGKKSSMMVLNTITSMWVYEFMLGVVEEGLKERDIQTANNTILFLPTSKATIDQLELGKDFEKMLQRHQGLNVVAVAGVTTSKDEEMRRQLWEVLDKNPTSDDRPSTGLRLVEIAITFCDHIQVYGFYPFARDQQNHIVPYHYWDNVTSINSVLKRKHPHNFAAEFEILRTLHNNGVIEHKVGDCKHNS